ncbi:MAG: PfkB family carbohydrate kinase [Planctomycetota bacterium]
MSVLVVGSIALDTVRTRRETRTEVLGGSCTYFAVAASLLSPVRVVSVVGGDFPRAHIDLLRSRPVDLAGLSVRNGERTFRWAGTYAEDMNDRTTDDLQFGVLASFDPVLPPAYRDTPFVFLANAHPSLQGKVLDQMRSRPVALCDTIDHYIRTEPEAVRAVLARVDGAILNDAEARLLTGETNTVAAAGALLETGPRFAIVKKGEHGALLACGEGIFSVPAFPLGRVVDPTGAGDAFAGGVMGCLAREGSADIPTLRKALAYGTAAASFTCEDFSLDRLARVRPEELEARVAAFREMVRIP